MTYQEKPLLPHPFNFRIAGNGAAVHRHFLWSFSFQRFRIRRFHNANRKRFGQGLQSSSLAFAFAFAPRRIHFAGTVFVGIGHGATLIYFASSLSISTTSEIRRRHPISRRGLPPSRCGPGVWPCSRITTNIMTSAAESSSQTTKRNLCSFVPSGLAPLMVFVEIFFAVDTWNRMTDHLSGSSKNSNMNLLFGPSSRHIARRPLLFPCEADSTTHGTYQCFASLDLFRRRLMGSNLRCSISRPSKL
jgi:hypothetical protein